MLGEGHENDTLEFRPMTFKDAEELEQLQVEDPKDKKATMAAVDNAIEFLKGKFVTGNIKGIKVVADDFSNGELPVEVLNYCMRELAGQKSEDFTKP